MNSITLRELQDTVNFYVSNLHDDEDPVVVVSLHEPSVGAGASTGIRHACRGFDFEHNQFLLTPEERLCRFGWRQDDPQPKRGDKFDGRSYYTCPRCGGATRVKKDDRYCNHCGQRLSNEIKWKDW